MGTLCVEKDYKFIKGYVRLAAAQTEMKLYNDAEETLKAAIRIEPDNKNLGILSYYYHYYHYHHYHH
jgi:cytochrome c-type biogenesis protein CcmH/NrfG